jgi:uncharacterized protein (TIGR00299 family) protein
MAQNLLYLDPWSGLSGDMMLAALLDAGGQAAESALHEAVASLGLVNTTVEITHDVEWGIACTRVNVRAEQSPPLRHLSDMLEVIGGAILSERVKAQARAAVGRLAEVEAGIHGCSVEQIHFHEVGAADTLVDVVGTFVLIEALGVNKVFVGTIPVGGGTVEIAHGRMGVPAPATAALLAGYQVAGGPEMRELTTPTGALLAGQLQAQQGPLPAMTVMAIGYGAGTMKLAHGPNLLRVVLGEATGGGSADAAGIEGLPGEAVVELQTNIDDVSPEVIGHTLRRLRQAGALDAWTVAAQMKKDRPGVVLHVLVAPGREAETVDILFAETGTLGVRRSDLSRYVADRGTVSVGVAGHEVAVKWGRWGGRMVSLAPEYEDAAAAAALSGLPLREVMHQASEAAQRLLEQGERT